MFYFENRPTISYDIFQNEKPITVTDIMGRFIIDSIVGDRYLVLQDYTIQDGERADTVAYKLYGDASLDWIIILTNQMYDPYYEWPLDYKQFRDYVIQKYGSISNAMEQTHHYEQIIQSKSSFVGYDGTKLNVPERMLVVDYTTYNTLEPNEKRLVTSYEYEEAQNEQRRKIKTINPALIPELLQKYESIFK